jgi:hypothetical protein
LGVHRGLAHRFGNVPLDVRRPLPRAPTGRSAFPELLDSSRRLFHRITGIRNPGRVDLAFQRINLKIGHHLASFVQSRHYFLREALEFTIKIVYS